MSDAVCPNPKVEGRLSKLETAHGIHVAASKERHKGIVKDIDTNANNIAKNENSISELRKAHAKLSFLVALLASGGGAVGSAAVNYFMKGM